MIAATLLASFAVHVHAAALALPLACSGHLLIDLPIFMGPVVVLTGWLLLMTRRARRGERPDQMETMTSSDPEIRDHLFGVHA